MFDKKFPAEIGRLVRRITNEFHSANHGAVLIQFATAVLILFSAVGIAIDYGTAASKRAELQGLIDAASLAGAVTPGDETAKTTAATTHFDLTAPQSILEELDNRQFSYNNQLDAISATAQLNSQAYFAGIIGVNEIPVSVISQAAQASPGAKSLDIAMCIDATGSMYDTIQAVKSNALQFESDLAQAIENLGLQPYDSIRVRPIYYRDFGGNNPVGPGGIWNPYTVSSGGNVDKYPNGVEWRPAGDARNYGDDVPLRASADFFELPGEKTDFHSFVLTETESGGGDYPEAGLECVNEAMDSPWVRVGDPLPGNSSRSVAFAYHVIVVWTDANAQEPSFNYSLLNTSYPPASKMPRNYADLQSKWQDENVIGQEKKLLALFIKPSAPTSGWDPLMQWDKYINAGTLDDGNTMMVNKIADAIATMDDVGLTARLTK